MCVYNIYVFLKSNVENPAVWRIPGLVVMGNILTEIKFPV